WRRRLPSCAAGIPIARSPPLTYGGPSVSCGERRLSFATSAGRGTGLAPNANSATRALGRRTRKPRNPGPSQMQRRGRRSNPQASVEDLVELLLDAGGRADRLTILRTVDR